jgi:hypothetical protein
VLQALPATKMPISPARGGTYRLLHLYNINPKRHSLTATFLSAAKPLIFFFAAKPILFFYTAAQPPGQPLPSATIITASLNSYQQTLAIANAYLSGCNGQTYRLPSTAKVGRLSIRLTLA